MFAQQADTIWVGIRWRIHAVAAVYITVSHRSETVSFDVRYLFNFHLDTVFPRDIDNRRPHHINRSHRSFRSFRRPHTPSYRWLLNIKNINNDCRRLFCLVGFKWLRYRTICRICGILIYNRHVFTIFILFVNNYHLRCINSTAA